MDESYISEKTIEKLIIYMAQNRGLFAFKEDKVDEALMFSVNELPVELRKKYFPEIHRDDDGKVSPLHVNLLFGRVIDRYIMQNKMYYVTHSFTDKDGKHVEDKILQLDNYLLNGVLNPEERRELEGVERRLYAILTGQDL